MLETGGHHCRWYIAHPAHDCSDGLWGQVKRWLTQERRPRGRRRIDPALPYGHWAMGWTAPVKPTKKAR